MTPFEEILGWHLSCGLVHSTPEVFLLAQECHWTGTEMISRRDAEAQRKEQRPGKQTQDLPMNAWFVELAAAGTFSRRGAAVTDAEHRPGKQTQSNPVKEFMRVATHPLPYVLWCRQSKGRKHDIHSYKWDHLARRVGYTSPSSL